MPDIDNSSTLIEELEKEVQYYKNENACLVMARHMDKTLKQDSKEAFKYIKELENKNIFQLIFWYFTKKSFLD